MIFTLTLLVLMFILVFYDRIVITVPAGHVGVYYDWLFGGTDLKNIYREGIHLIFPWNKMFLYDCRSQKADYEVSVLIEGGLRVVVHSSIVWRVIPDTAPLLHVSAGLGYKDILITPAMTAGIRTSAGLQPDLYSQAFDAFAFEEDILAYVQQFINNGAFNFQAVLLREIELPAPMLAAINRKFAAEQGVLEQRFNVLRAYESFRQRYIDAEGVRLAARLMNEGLTENYLRYLGIEATRLLAESHNSKLVVIGDKDGLPLILNPDSMTASQSPLPSTVTPAPNVLQPSIEPALEMQSVSDYLGLMNRYLDELEQIPGFEAATMPQASGTRTTGQ